MADWTGNSDAFEQLVIKAGASLVVTALAGYYYLKKSSFEQVESTARESDVAGVEQVIDLSFLVGRTNEIRVRVEELNARFERYLSKNENEGNVKELENMLGMEMLRLEYLENEVSWKDYEIKRMEDMIKRSRDEVEKGTYDLNKMAEEIRELKDVVKELNRNREKIEGPELEAELAESSLAHQHEEEISITMEEYIQTKNELEKSQKEFEDAENERVRLRWKNACLRRRLIDLGAAGRTLLQNGVNTSGVPHSSGRLKNMLCTKLAKGRVENFKTMSFVMEYINLNWMRV